VSGGTTITVVGSGFVAGAMSVELSKGKALALVATDVKVMSPTELTAVTPTGGMLGKKYSVRVVGPGGSSPTNKGARFAYLPAPSTTKISPTAGPTGGHTVVTITGSEFVKGSTVDFGSVSALRVTYVSSKSLSAVAPAGSAGKVNVTVTTPSGRSTGNLHYTYDLTPTVTSVTPDSGPVAGGTLVTVEGSGFVRGETTVEVGQSPANAARAVRVDVVSTTEIQLETGRANRPGRMTLWVLTAGGVNSPGPGDSFKYTNS
jgi:hypothetical protein